LKFAKGGGKTTKAVAGKITGYTNHGLEQAMQRVQKVYGRK
jgi:hypothetical protein